MAEQANIDTKGGSALKTAAVLLVLTAIAGGVGVMLGKQLVETVAEGLRQTAESKPEPEAAPIYTGSVGLVHLPPIVTNLAAPSEIWVRLEAAIILEGEIGDGADVLAAEIAGDLVAYLRTLSLPELQGGSGLLYLIEDLNDRAAIRSNDQVRELVITSLVVQ